MAKTKLDHTPETLAERLLPERLSHLLDERPLLWCEDEDEYDALLGEIFAELDPKGVIESLLAKDVVDYIWEIRRMRALKQAALHAELPHAAALLIEPAYGLVQQSYHAHISKPEIFAALAGVKHQVESLEARMKASHVTPQMMQYEAFKSGMATISAIDVAITRLERRRDQLLKSLSERRQAFKAMAKGLIERDAAQEVDMGQAN